MSEMNDIDKINSENSDENKENPSPNTRNPKNLTVILTTGDVSFTVARSLLTQNSEYFKAMLDGNFKEANQNQIFLHNITADAMESILNFFNFNTFDIQNLDNVGELFDAANYFGLDSFYQLVEKKIIHFIKIETCFKIFQISKDHNLSVVEPIVKSFILYSFSDTSEHICEIKDINILSWYLSHLHLNVSDEIDVFNAGCQWISKFSKNNDDILILLSCLIYYKINQISLITILNHKFVKNNKLAEFVVNGIIYVQETCSLESFFEPTHNRKLRDYFENDVYEIIHGLLSCEKQRSPPVRPCILKKSKNSLDIMTFDSNEKKLVPCIPLPDDWWGQNVVSWKGFSLLILFGKMKNYDTWNYDIRCYDCLTRKWEILPSKIPSPRRHATAIVHGDLLYVIGGFGQFRVVLNSANVYDIKTQDWSTLPDLPEYSSSLVACFHRDRLYVSGEYLYVLENDQWHNLGALKARHSAFISHNNYILFTRRWIKELHFLGIDMVGDKMKKYILSKSHYHVSGMLSIGNEIYVFSEGDGIDNSMAVEKLILNNDPQEDFKAITNLLWLDNETDGVYHSSSGCFTLIDFNTTDNFINKYGERWLK